MLFPSMTLESRSHHTWSRIILWNSVPGVSMSKDDLHSGCRSRDLGVMITSGFLGNSRGLQREIG